MVKMKHYLRMLATQLLSILYSTLCHILKQGLVGIVACALRHLKDNRRLEVRRSLDDGLQLLHVVEIEGGDGITAVDGFLKHLFGVYQAQSLITYHN